MLACSRLEAAVNEIVQLLVERVSPPPLDRIVVWTLCESTDIVAVSTVEGAAFKGFHVETASVTIV